MHRIDAPNHVANLFSEGNPSISAPATTVSAAWLNDVQENIATVIVRSGLPLTKGRAGDLADAITIGAVHIYETVTELRASDRPGRIIQIRGYAAAGDGGGGQYWHDATDDASADDGGALLVDVGGRRWKWWAAERPLPSALWGIDRTAAVDVSAAVQAFFDAAAGGESVLLVGEYRIGAPLTMRAGTTLYAAGATFIADGLAAETVLTLEEGCTLHGLEIVGDGKSVAGGGILIHAAGTRNGAAAPTIVRGPSLYGVKLREAPHTAIRYEFVRGVNIIECDIEACGYAGVILLSVEGFDVSRNRVSDIGATSGVANAYGMIFSRMVDAQSYGNLTACPRSQHGTVRANRIDGVWGWAGLDTHGGSDISFKQNIITNCSRGINITFSHRNQIGDFGPQNITVASNQIDGRDRGGHCGIIVNGAVDPTTIPVNKEVEYAEGIRIIGNTIRNHNSVDGSSRAGIALLCTWGIVVIGNDVRYCGRVGIWFNRHNIGGICQGNALRDIWSVRTNTPGGICIGPQNNVLSLGGNVIRKTAPNGLALGSITVSGIGGQVDSITVNGIDILGTPVAWAGTIQRTSAAVAAQINAHTSAPDYTATVFGPRIVIAAAVSGTGHDGYVVSGTASGGMSLIEASPMAAGGRTYLAYGVQAEPGATGVALTWTERDDIVAGVRYRGIATVSKNRPSREEGIVNVAIGTATATVTQAVTFLTPFGLAPIVLLSPSVYKVGTSAITVRAANVTTTGCDMVIETVAGTNFNANTTMTVAYIASGY